jgi:hypothetical protein
VAIKCKLWWDNSVGAYRISTPYSPQFVDYIKASIPGSDRAYDKATHYWTFSEKYFKQVEDVIKKLWPTEHVIISHAQAQSASAPPALARTAITTAIEEFFLLLPFDAANAAYRKAALELHPDREGGNMEKMSKLNALWDRIKKEVFKQ